jgi:hypothetical protein
LISNPIPDSIRAFAVSGGLNPAEFRTGFGRLDSATKRPNVGIGKLEVATRRPNVGIGKLDGDTRRLSVGFGRLESATRTLNVGFGRLIEGSILCLMTILS